MRPLVILGLAALWGLVPFTRWWHGRVEVHVALAWITAVVATGFALAVAVIIRSIERGHRGTREVVEEVRDSNVIPFRRPDPGDDTQVLPLVAVGVAKPVGMKSVGGETSRPGRQLSYTAGDATIDVWIHDVIEDTG